MTARPGLDGAALGAGPELDALVGREIFGIKKLHYPHGDQWPYYIPSGKPWRTHKIDAIPFPSFSRDIMAAFMVVSRMKRDGWSVHMLDWGKPIDHSGDDPCTGAVVRFMKIVDGKAVQGRTNGEETLTPLAICRAAIAALAAQQPADAGPGE